MLSLVDIRSYADIRRLVSPAAFSVGMEFIAWHNQQRQTPPLPLWQAIVVAYACDSRPIDRMLFGSIKTFLRERDLLQPGELAGCRIVSAALLGFLFPHEESH